MQEGTVLRNNYRLERLLGRGGMADVYLAFDARRHVRVAIKILREDLAEDPEFVRRFTREAEALARLEHPNIVRFYSFEREGATAFIVMDYVTGTTLQRRLAEGGGPLPPQVAALILRQVAAALQYAHGQGYIHRDVKPANIMLREDGGVLLSDFGIARAAESATQSTLAVGTPAYMSPEQILGRELDRRTDVYSLGTVLYEMTTGRRPFTGDESGLTATTTLARLREAHLRLAPPDPRTFNPVLPARAVSVIMHALAKRPDDRWPDVIGMVQAWEAAIKEAGIPVAEAPAVPSAPPGGPVTPAGTRSGTPAWQTVPAPPPGAVGGQPSSGPFRPATRPVGSARLSGGPVWALLGAVAMLGLTALVVVVVIVAGKLHPNAPGVTPTPVASSTSRAAVVPPTRTVAPPSSTPLPSATVRPGPSATPAASATPRSRILYAVDFDTVSPDWEESSDADVTRSYSDGEYHILVESQKLTAWTTPGQSFKDFSLEVEATKVAGPDDNGFGVLLRYVDSQNFYYFEISSDGYWDFSKQENDVWTTLATWSASDAIKQGAATNVIKVVCDAGAFDFYVNGTRIGDYFDGTFTEGDIGLSASAYDVGGIHIAFDNLEIRPLE